LHIINFILFFYFLSSIFKIYLFLVNDGTVFLYRVTSISSAPITAQLNPGIQLKEDDGLIHIYDDHEDSVYSIAWSSASAWIFASVSYKGNLDISVVPSNE
jgi:hypothetical protein